MSRELAREINSFGQFEAMASGKVKKDTKSVVSQMAKMVRGEILTLERGVKEIVEHIRFRHKVNVSDSLILQMVEAKLNSEAVS